MASLDTIQQVQLAGGHCYNFSAAVSCPTLGGLSSAPDAESTWRKEQTTLYKPNKLDNNQNKLYYSDKRGLISSNHKQLFSLETSIELILEAALASHGKPTSDVVG